MGIIMKYKINYTGGSENLVKFSESEKKLLENLELISLVSSDNKEVIKNILNSYPIPEDLNDDRLKKYLQHCVSKCGGYDNIIINNKDPKLPDKFTGTSGPRPEGNTLAVLEKYYCRWHKGNCDIICFGDIYKKIGKLSSILNVNVKNNETMLNLLDLLKLFYSKSVDTGTESQKLLAQRIEIIKELRKVTRDLEDITKKINKLEKDRDGSRMKMLKTRFQKQIDVLDPDK